MLRHSRRPRAVMAEAAASANGRSRKPRTASKPSADTASESEPLLAGQVLLARELPDYWQRFETHRAAYARACLQAPPPRGGWLSRLLGGDHAARKPGSDG